MATGRGRESGAGFAEAVLAAPMGGGNGGGGKPRKPMPALPKNLPRRSTDQAPTGEGGVSPGERDLLLEDPLATLPDGPLAVDFAVSETAGQALGPVLRADTHAEAHHALMTIRSPEDLRLELETMLEAINPNMTLPLGGQLFLAIFTAWNAVCSQLKGDLNDADRDFCREIIQEGFFARAIQNIDALIDRQALAVQQVDVEPKTCPVWVLYDVVRKLAKAAGEDELVAKLEEKWELVQYIHAKQIARVDAPSVAEAIKTHFRGKRDISILDIGARTGDALAELMRILGSIEEIDDKTLSASAIDLNPRKPMLAEVLAGHRFLGSLPPVKPVEVQAGDVLHLGATVPKKQDVILAWNILHKLPEGNHAEAIKQIAASQNTGGVLMLHMPYFDDRPGSLKGPIGKLLQRIDTGNGTIRSIGYWERLLQDNGYRVFTAKSVGTKTGNLDCFQHVDITAIRENEERVDATG